MSERLVARSRAVDAGLDLLAIAAVAGERCVYLELPARQEAWLGVGAARVVVAEGVDRFARADREMRRLGATVDGDSQACWLGGFAFADGAAVSPEWRELPPLLFVLPELLWRKTRDGCRLTTFAAADGQARLDAVANRLTSAPIAAWRSPPASSPGFVADEAERFRARVTTAMRAIAAGELDKVVVSLRRELGGFAAWEAPSICAAARAARPECATFLVRGERTSFLGSTPELLARKRGALVDAMAIAGSAPRGESAERDARLAAELLACAKNAAEHRLVVNGIERALAPIARRLASDPVPSLLRLPEAQHLRTAVTAVLADETMPFLELAGRLHPTPAVCGVPLEAARRRLAEEEPDRGWYAGAVGWADARGDGELFVAIRSMVLDGSRAILRAGAGIVAASDPANELAEVEAKLGALLAPPARHAA